MIADVKIIKGLPIEQIDQFVDKTVYNTAVITREFTKNANAYPYLTGELMRQEVAQPVVGSDKNYGLLSGVDYAKYVWNFKKANWTNPSTKPRWYYSVFNKDGATILCDAVIKSLKGLK